MLNEFSLLVHDALKAVNQKKRRTAGGYNFADLMQWQKSFHILRPITSKPYLDGFITRLKNGFSSASGNGVEIDEAKLDAGVTLKSCTCENGRRCCAGMLCYLEYVAVLRPPPHSTLTLTSHPYPQALRLLPSRLR